MSQMKFLLVVLVFAGFSQMGQAQTIEKGVLSPGLFFTSAAGGLENSPSIGISFSYYVANNLGIGLNAFNFVFGEDYSSSTFGPYARYYFGSGSFYGQAGITFSSVKVGDESDSATGLNLGAGYSFFITDDIAIEPSLALNRANETTVISMAIGASFLF
ncbi:MAG: hypothetical protein H6568_10065 [Lewinellaceae bacterium]|nr:hypothetical protein [Lewinellaceae bacterium]